MASFTYTRNEQSKTLPYDPTAEGFDYSHCQCSYVKFFKIDGENETQLSFYPDKRKIQVNRIKHGEKGSTHLGSRTIEKYPTNQEELKEILKEI